MSNTSHQRERRSTARRLLRMAAAGVGTALLLGGTAVTASAEPVTESINWRSDSGTTASGVEWAAVGGLPNNRNVSDGDTRTMTFSEPVTATFNVTDLNGNVRGSRECAVLPETVTPVRLDPNNTWTASTHTLCYNGPNPGDADLTTTSSFRTTEPVLQLWIRGEGAPGWQRTITDLQVTTDDGPPIPMIAPAFAATGLLATGALAGVRRLRDARRGAAQEVVDRQA